jgi:predicted DCC family thiol-disulfide oxidoreductase YuxK
VVSKGLLERWDRKRFVRFVPCPTGLQSIWFADGKGGMVSGVPAFRALLPFLPMGKILALFFLLPGMNRLAVCIYRIIAKNRYRWFGAAEKE